MVAGTRGRDNSPWGSKDVEERERKEKGEDRLPQDNLPGPTSSA